MSWLQLWFSSSWKQGLELVHCWLLFSTSLCISPSLLASLSPLSYSWCFSSPQNIVFPITLTLIIGRERGQPFAFILMDILKICIVLVKWFRNWLGLYFGLIRCFELFCLVSNLTQRDGLSFSNFSLPSAVLIILLFSGFTTVKGRCNIKKESFRWLLYGVSSRIKKFFDKCGDCPEWICNYAIVWAVLGISG
jgi:hypothetical protein